jgi:hypothetical protein
MQSEATAWQIGHAMTNRRIDDLDHKLMGHVAILHRKIKSGNGHGGKRIPWMQFAAMGTVALSSLIGLLSPEKAAAILRALIH